MLLTWSIFWALKNGKISLILSTSDVLMDILEAWAYDLPELLLLPWFLFSTIDFLEWKYLEMMLTSFLVLAGRGGSGGTLLIVTGTDFAIFFLLPLLEGMVLGVNFEEILALRVLDFWSVYKKSYLAS